jgi:hypothetical protein
VLLAAVQVKLQQLRDSGELTRVLEQLEAVHFDLPAVSGWAPALRSRDTAARAH